MAKNQAKIVIVGGGFGGLFTALDLAGTGEVKLISDHDHFLFRPMLYEYLSGEVEAWHIAPDFKELLDSQAQFVRGCVKSIDTRAQTVVIENYSEPMPYDILVFAPGAITHYARVEGAEQFSLPFRTLADADR